MIRLSLVAALLLLAPALLQAQRADIRATAEPDKTTVPYSGHLHVTLALEGPAPLRVKLPDQVLTADADGAWRIRPVGAAEIRPTANGREQWAQTYRLDPFADSTPLVASFSPVTVNGQEVTWPSVTVNVTRSVAPETPPQWVTPPEDVPPPPSQPPAPSALPWVAGAVGLMCVAVLAAAMRRARRPKPVPPWEWALAALAKLEEADAVGAEAVEQVAAIVRTFVERRFAVPATKLTTGELLAAAREQGWPVEQTDPLGALLDECDRAKFAGDVPDDDGCRRLIRVAVDWLNDVGRPAGPG